MGRWVGLIGSVDFREGQTSVHFCEDVAVTILYCKTRRHLPHCTHTGGRSNPSANLLRFNDVASIGESQKKAGREEK